MSSIKETDEHDECLRPKKGIPVGESLLAKQGLHHLCQLAIANKVEAKGTSVPATLKALRTSCRKETSDSSFTSTSYFTLLTKR